MRRLSELLRPRRFRQRKVQGQIASTLAKEMLRLNGRVNTPEKFRRGVVKWGAICRVNAVGNRNGGLIKYLACDPRASLLLANHGTRD
ncbi:hypothetical protein CEXT_380971 [Caerostris extrusa]|uniref:Uncharacterized protein n=1 Tax=Caerostris extrusa TaxID=172846 RepID=A0AAV4NAK4_CAEEX|nr:hypothetical protein CEXT_380971 [Caerostris extrusa]